MEPAGLLSGEGQQPWSARSGVHDPPGKQVRVGTTGGVGCEGSSRMASPGHANKWTFWGIGRGQDYLISVLEDLAVLSMWLSSPALEFFEYSHSGLWPIS